MFQKSHVWAAAAPAYGYSGVVVVVAVFCFIVVANWLKLWNRNFRFFEHI